MNISSDLPSPVSRMATPLPTPEATEGREPVADHDGDDAPKVSLKPYQGTKVDTKA